MTGIWERTAHSNSLTHTPTHIHTLTFTHIHSHTLTHIHTHIYTHSHTLMHTHTHSHSRTHTHTHSHSLTHMHTRPCTQTYALSHTHTRTEIQKNRDLIEGCTLEQQYCTHILFHTHTHTHVHAHTHTNTHAHTHVHARRDTHKWQGSDRGVYVRTALLHITGRYCTRSARHSFTQPSPGYWCVRMSMCWSVLQHVAVCCGVLTLFYSTVARLLVCTNEYVLHCVAACCSVLQRVIVCCGVLWCVGTLLLKLSPGYWCVIKYAVHVLQRVAVCWNTDTKRYTINTLEHAATIYCNTLQHTGTRRCTMSTLKNTAIIHCNTLQHTATHCNTLQHTATHCNTLQHTATTHCNTSTRRCGMNTLQHTATIHCNTLQHTATHCNTLQHTATHCNTLQHTATQVPRSAQCLSVVIVARECQLCCSGVFLCV